MSKIVNCANCGYLCKREIGYEEIYSNDRKNIDNIEIKTPSELHCYRRIFNLGQELRDEVNGLPKSEEPKITEPLKRVIEKPRYCRYYLKYVPGYSPEQHLMRWENLEREKSNRKWSLIYIVIGAGITAVGTAIGALAIKLIFV